MPLYLLMRDPANRQTTPAWEDVESAVVRASSGEEARRLIGAVGWPNDLYRDKAFLDPEKTVCVELSVEGPAEAIVAHIIYG